MKKMCRAIGVGCVVSYNYILRDERGRIIEETSGWPFRYVHSTRPGVIKGVYRALGGRKVDDRFTLKVSPEEAYGAYDPAAKLSVSRDRTNRSSRTEWTIGEEVTFHDGTRTVVATVQSISATEILLDLNHPLAGKTLHFDIEIVGVRAATAEELRTNLVEDPFHRAESRAAARTDMQRFPFDLFNDKALFARMGRDVMSIFPYAMHPPFPWGQRLYGQVFKRHCRQLEGDVIELGVGLGGMSLYLARLAKRVHKHVYSFDSFIGLPPPVSSKENPGFKAGDYRGAQDKPDLLTRFVAAAERVGVRDSVTPVKGFFDKTLPKLPRSQRFCFAHLDSDLYDSIYVSLEHVYDRVVDGGVIAIDDFFHHAQGPARAVADFFNSKKVHPILHVSFPYSVFVVKGEVAPSRWHRSLDGNCYSFEWLRRDPLLREAVTGSLAKVKKDRRLHERCRALLDLLEAEAYSNADIYRYWHALEDYWDSFAKQGHRPQALEI